ncbi:MAG TPA: dTMP kinase [Steroidobacteraceae bacterium]|nr:dTMP kinase [Steroidobacteraceae bacterium]
MSGKFITLEGGEGVGKTTQLKVVEATLQQAGLNVIMTREPGGTERAEHIRELLLARDTEPMPPSCELLLMFAPRATHLHNVIKPALQRGDWVVCDRFTDASYAYQGYGRGLSIEDIRELERMVHDDIQPDMTLLLDAPVELGMQRAQQRSASGAQETDRFEAEQLGFFERVRLGCNIRAGEHAARFRIIDASQPLDNVSAAIRTVVMQFIQASRS